MSRTERSVTPLERTALFDIHDEDGYVHIEQSVGDPVHYTPEEARDIAEDILAAVERAERD
jgi:hypothetical protein